MFAKVLVDKGKWELESFKLPYLFTPYYLPQ